jgi:hypothetical protein
MTHTPGDNESGVPGGSTDFVPADIGEQLRLLTLEVQTLQLQVARNQATLERLVVACEKMTDHIDFVDTVYDRVRHPLTYVASLVGSTGELPARGARLLRGSDDV